MAAQPLPAGLGEQARAAAAILSRLSGGVAGALFHVGTEQLGSALGCSRQHAGRVLHQLEDAGVIRRITTGNNLTKRVSSFAWALRSTPARALAARPQTKTEPEEKDVTLNEARRLSAAGQVPAGGDRLPADLRPTAGIAWDLAGRREGGEFVLGTVPLGEALGCSAATAGRRLKRLVELGVVRLVRRGSQRHHRATRYAWAGTPRPSG